MGTGQLGRLSGPRQRQGGRPGDGGRRCGTGIASVRFPGGGTEKRFRYPIRGCAYRQGDSYRRLACLACPAIRGAEVNWSIQTTFPKRSE